MLIWGSAGEVIRLGEEREPQHCPFCEKDRRFYLTLTYRYAHVYYIFGFVNEKRYALVCENCQRGTEVDARLVEPQLDGNPIPFMHRFGCLVLVGIVAGIALWRVLL